MKPFDRLTNLGRGRRLKPHAARLLRERYGIRAARLQQVAETINIVLRIRADDGARYVLRMTPPKHFHDLADVRSELAWLRSLTEHDVRVPIVVPTRDGSAVVSLSWDGIPGEWHCVVFRWIDGTHLADRWTLPNLARFGELVAKLHKAAEAFDAPPGFRVRPADTVFPHCKAGFAQVERLVLFDGLPERLLPAHRLRLFRRAADLAQTEITRLFESGVPRPIHNDLHPWNVMINRREIHAIDFENMLMGFPIQDLGTAFNYMRRDEGFDDRVKAVREGYERVSPWPEEFPGQRQLMTTSHRLLVCNYYASHHDREFREYAYKYFEASEKRIEQELEAS
jgi:hydroxylysine kinase